jgi:hypothetical protein
LPAGGLIHTALSLARFYGVEAAVDDAITQTHAELAAQGHIKVEDAVSAD